jgi:Tol biopolymer transport system component
VRVRYTSGIIFLLFFAMLGEPPLLAETEEQLDDIRQIISARELGLRGEIFNIAISPSNPNIISFETVEGGHLHRLWRFHVVKKELEQITPRDSNDQDYYWQALSDRDINWCPVIKNGKSWFLFVSNGIEGQENIYLGNTEQDYYLRLTSGMHVDHHPRWAPDGGSFVYVSSRAGSGDIYYVKNVDELINRFEWAVQQSPGSPEIVIDGISSGSDHLRITSNPGMDSFPDWSPDGRYIVYQGLIRTDDVLNIDLFLLDTGKITAEPVNLTQNPRQDGIQPKWSYDQKNIAYYVSPAGRGSDAPAIVHLAYIQIQSDSSTGDITSFASMGTIDANIRRNNNTGPLWGPGSRSLLYVKGDGNHTPVLMYKTTDSGSVHESQTMRESRFDIIHREIAGYVSVNYTVVVYLTYEDQDYRIYIARPDGGILSHKETDVYVRPQLRAVNVNSPSYKTGIGVSAMTFLNQDNPSRTGFNFLNSLFLQYTFFSYTRSPLPFLTAIRTSINTINPVRINDSGTWLLFSYAVLDIEGVLFLPIDFAVRKTMLYGFGGVGYVFAHEGIGGLSFWKRVQVPFGFGMQYSLTPSLNITGQVTFRSVPYRVDAKDIYSNLQTRGLSVGMVYRI